MSSWPVTWIHSRRAPSRPQAGVFTLPRPLLRAVGCFREPQPFLQRREILHPIGRDQEIVLPLNPAKFRVSERNLQRTAHVWDPFRFIGGRDKGKFVHAETEAMPNHRALLNRDRIGERSAKMLETDLSRRALGHGT